MRVAFHQRILDSGRALLGRRSGGFLLALVVELLILLLLLTLGWSTKPPLEVKRKNEVFQMLPDPQVAPKPTAKGKTVAKVKQASGGAAPRAVAPVETPPPPPPPLPSSAPPKMIVLSKDEFASSDLATRPTHNGDGEAGEGESSGKDSGAAYGPGQGPGGAPLYNAEWYREPTRAELAFYMPANAQTGYALIACKTIANFHVENCRSLDETPGSGLARALRLASWQFLVRPPRIGGKPMIGAWVRIHYDLTVGVAK